MIEALDMAAAAIGWTWLLILALGCAALLGWYALEILIAALFELSWLLPIWWAALFRRRPDPPVSDFPNGTVLPFDEAVVRKRRGGFR